MTRFLFLGDTSDWNIPDFSVNRLSPKLRCLLESADVCVFNLEGLITFSQDTWSLRKNSGADLLLKTILAATGKQQPRVTSTQNILEILELPKKTVVTLAHNHIKDAGKENYLKTLDALQKRNMTPVGHASSLEHQCCQTEVENLVIISINEVASHKFGIRFNMYGPSKGFYGAAFMNIRELTREIKILRQTGRNVVCIVHAGRELPGHVSDLPFEKYAEINADITLFNHPHCYFETDYENQNMYVPGDFIFLRPGKLDLDRKSAVIELETNGEFSVKKHIYTMREIYTYG